MNQFYTPDLLGQVYVLNQEESKHSVKVLRLKYGDIVQLADGKGNLHEAKITVADARACQLQILSTNYEVGKLSYHLTIAIAPTKNIDRFEWFVEKATEIGVSEIIPLICRYSERKEIKSERIEKVIISAMKQSGRAYLPTLSKTITFKELINQHPHNDLFIAHCEKREKKQLINSIIPGNSTLILIGPEGDFSSEEIDSALKNGFIPVSLGESRLRTETAGVVACHTVSLVNRVM